MALSYVWDNESQKVPIICDGKPVAVTPSLLTVSQKFCGHKKDNWLWADGLCIGQQKNLEKNIQVAMIVTFHGNASEVFFWLRHDLYGDAPVIFADSTDCLGGSQKLLTWEGSPKVSTLELGNGFSGLQIVHL